ncbi:MAG: carboxypeptidase regulatory-like domain-containing protein [Thermoplasmata archaeon]|nr:carboxypeptidase regulatory-like domain-containing protein [Thermoplasmata archaeon]
MESRSDGWWSRHGWTVLVLAAAFSITFLIRTLWNLPLFEQYGTTYYFAGGSDSFYHWRVSDYILLNHANLVHDPLLKYPAGAINPREPLFDWMNAVFGLLFAPLFGGSAMSAGMFSLEVAPPLWAALSVVPIYLVGKEVSSRRMGLIAALIWPFLVANIDSSTFGYANYLSFYTFFILVMIYSYLRTIRAAGTRRWVTSYRHPRDILRGLRDFLYYEKAAVKWAVFTGVSFSAVVLTWQGYTFLVALVIVFVIVQMVVERVRRIDSLGLYLTTWIVGLVGFPISFPYYFAQGDYHIWFLEPVLIYFGALLILLPFLLLRDQPWVISIPVLVLTSAGALGALVVAAPAQFADILSGQGYFVKTLIYSTVAEAQAPSIDSLIVGYGVVTFFFAFAGVGFVVFQMVRGRFERRHLLFLLLGLISIYLPISAAKFFYIGSAAFSLLPAEALTRVLDIGGYPTLRRNVVSLSDRRSQLSALRRSFKARHVLVFLLVLAIIVPNVWYGIDAGIPYNSKSGYDSQVYNALPPALRVSPTNASSYYFGAAGSSLDTPSQYDEAGYDWLATQDTNLPEPQRPALVSWWDYGFQTIAEGHHPSVADNFQNGIDPSGNFLLSQNESEAIGVLATTLLSAEAQATGQPYLPAGLNAVLAGDGVNLAALHPLLANASADLPLVEAHPERYVAVNPATITADNAMYDAVSYFLASTLPLSRVAQVYNDIQAYTGWSIRYPMVDSRLIPFSGQNTGIFYAPADLTGRVIGPGGEPTSYYTVSVVGSDGNSYPAGTLPAGVTAVTYNINYTPAFYNTMIYHTYFGYSAQEVGQAAGVPWLSQSQQEQTDPLQPGWMLQHFQVVYRTAYACPQPNQTAGSSCFRATNVPTAQHIQSKEKGSSDLSLGSYFQGGEAILQYYPGVPTVGNVVLPNGRAVPDARVTAYDGWGVPHMTTLTGSDGAYSLILPPGRDTINVSTGSLNLITQAGATHLATFNVTVPSAYGLSDSAPTMVQPLVIQPATVEGFLSWSASNSSSGSPSPVVGATVVLWGHNLSRLAGITDASGSFGLRNVPPGIYNVSIVYRSSNFTESTATALPGKNVNETLSLSEGEVRGTVKDSAGRVATGVLVTVSGALGVIATGSTNSSGRYRIADLGPGNYTVVASTQSPRQGSLSQALNLATPGANKTLNFTIVPVGPVSVEVLRDGTPVSGTPVRFTQWLPPVVSVGPTNNSTAAHVTQQKANSTVVLTNADGVAAELLPAGNYSVYALGYNGSGYFAGYWSGPIGPGLPDPPPISVYPASELFGSVTGTVNASVSVPIEVAAYNHLGKVVWAFANSSGRYALWLPNGEYSVLAFSPNPNQAVLAKAVVSGTTRLDLVTTPTSLATTVVTDNATGRPILGASVNFTLESNGATVAATSDSHGNASAVLPSVPPPSSRGAPPVYCINVTATGYLGSSRCGVAAGTLPTGSAVRLVGAPVQVTILLMGLPGGASVHVNLTATSPGARTLRTNGSSPIAVSISPGSYSVTAWAPGSPTGFYFPVAATSFTVAPGAIPSSVTVRLTDQVESHGTLTVPAGASAPRAQVEFVSPVMNETVSYGALVNGFYLAPGSYEFIATVPGPQANQGWIAFGTVSLSLTGTLSTAFHLTGASVSFEGSVNLPTITPLTASAVVAFVSPSGFDFPAFVSSGSYNATLPANVTYTPFLNVTAPVVRNNVSVVEALSVPRGQVCAVRPVGTSCDITLVGREVNLTLDGLLSVANSPALVPGSVLLEGPAPTMLLTRLVTSANGSFSVSLSPGVYTVYANSTGGTYAQLSSVSLVFGNSEPLSLTLRPAWTAALTVLPPAGQTVGPVRLSIQTAAGADLVLPDVSLGAPLSVPLPVGTYLATASASSSPYGVPTNATASITFNLFSGNVGLSLALTEQIVRAVVLSITLPTNLTQSILLPPSGGTVSLGFSVHNTGNIPVSVTVIGNPSTWNFTITPSNFTLGTAPSNSSASGAFSVRVPAGTPVVHAPILLIADLAGTTQKVGRSVLPAPVSIQPRAGIALGRSASIDLAVTPTRVTIPLFAHNTGNFVESVRVSVVDGAALAQQGWTSLVQSASAAITGPLSIAVAGNTSVSIVLNASLGHAIPPGSVTVEANVLNQTGGAASSLLTVTIPVVSIAVNGSSIIVTGPNLGSPSATSDWLVPLLSFVPAMAFVVLLLAQRWYSTRRWVR